MKKIILAVLALAICIPCDSFSSLPAKIDERFELTGIAFRIAGAQEFSMGVIQEYNERIDNYFNPYISHPLIGYIKKIRNEYGIGYNAVTGLADILKRKDSGWAICDGINLEAYTNFDNRWNSSTIDTFITYLNDFYNDTKFNEFFTANNDLYVEAESAFDEFVTGLNYDWFPEFYGIDREFPRPYISLVNGPGNYSLWGEYKIHPSIVIGVSKPLDRLKENPMFRYYAIVHEIAHHFTNPVFYKYEDQIKDAAEKVFSHPYVNETVARYGYGDPITVAGEWLNDLMTLMYIKENGIFNSGIAHQEYFTMLSIDKEERGYIWMPGSLLLMKDYVSNRDTYPTLDDFMPTMVEHFNEVANNFGQAYQDYIDRHPKIISFQPEAPDKESGFISVKFSEPMETEVEAIGFCDELELLPFTDESYWQDSLTYRIPYDFDRLKPGVTYGVSLPKYGFFNPAGYYMLEDFKIVYTIPEK